VCVAGAAAAAASGAAAPSGPPRVEGDAVRAAAALGVAEARQAELFVRDALGPPPRPDARRSAFVLFCEQFRHEAAALLAAQTAAAHGELHAAQNTLAAALNAGGGMDLNQEQRSFVSQHASKEEWLVSLWREFGRLRQTAGFAGDRELDELAESAAEEEPFEPLDDEDELVRPDLESSGAISFDEMEQWELLRVGAPNTTPNGRASRHPHRRFLKGEEHYFALLPVVLLAGGYLILELNTSQQLQLNTLQQQQQQMAQRLRSAASIDELSALLPPGSPQPAGATLSQRRSTVLEALANAQLTNRQRLSQLHDQRLLKLLINSLRILLTALPTGLFFRMVAKPSYQLFNAVYKQLNQG